MGLLDAISPTPRNRILGLLADATQGVNDFASKPFGYDNPPARMLMGLLGVPSIATTLDRLSYGEPLTNIGKANVPLLKPETADAAMAAAAALPAVSRGALKASDAAVQAITKNPQATATKVMDYAAQMAPQRGLLSVVDGLDVSMARDAIAQHKARLIEEAKDWASRKYKTNDRQIQFEGDGPTRNESLSIGAINEGKKNKNVESRMAQVRALNSLDDLLVSNPAKAESMYLSAKRDAEMTANRDQLPFDQLFDARIGQVFAGMKDSAHGPGSVGGSIRAAIESAIKKRADAAPVATQDDDYLKILFGG